MLNKAEYRIIEEGAQIWEWTRVWNFTHIRSWANIWEICNIWNNVYIDADVVIWNSVKIQNWVNIYKWVTIEDDVFIWPAVTFTNDLYPRAFIWWEEKIVPTIVKKWASIGANATIKCGVVIWEYCLVWAGSMVIEDVEPFSIVVWNPAKKIGYVDKNWQKISEEAAKKLIAELER